MPVTVTPDSPRDPGATALLQASHAYLQSLYDPEDNHFLSIDELCTPDILFFVARLDGRAVGTAAIALRPGYGEIKSMYVDPAARGQGAAKALMERLVAEGRARGLPELKLETGPLNTEAMRLYARHGFSVCGRFGDYADSAASVFMQRTLTWPAPRRMASDEDMAPVHALLTESFAYMEGVIDPPSSMNRMSLADLAADAARNEVWVIEPGPVACMILSIKGDTLYLGKLAVSREHRGTGLARVMIEHAMARAQAHGLGHVTLQTRVELTANQATFLRLGFHEIERTAHAGYARPTSITYRRHL
ncbi:MAG: GNAT family N-acetyltransferase [Rhodobacteraceae bacterium]|nr:GNAT family N-acetyltransferase [Paracoccaceae bacterium]